MTEKINHLIMPKKLPIERYDRETLKSGVQQLISFHLFALQMILKPHFIESGLSIDKHFFSIKNYKLRRLHF